MSAKKKEAPVQEKVLEETVEGVAATNEEAAAIVEDAIAETTGDAPPPNDIAHAIEDASDEPPAGKEPVKFGCQFFELISIDENGEELKACLLGTGGILVKSGISMCAVPNGDIVSTPNGGKKIVW